MIKYIITLLCVQQFTVSKPAVQPGKLISYAIPENRALKKALGYNEDVYLNFTELSNKHGYPNEQHTIITEDGYILTAFRILPKCFLFKKYPVLLVHGIIDSSDAWILTGPKTGLGYLLADNCYDVWAINLRGNTYSRKHVYLDPDKDPEYWEFSFDESGYFDLPAIIDYVLEVTRLSKVYYVGHSQGTTIFFAMESLRSEYNNKVQLAVQLAPVAWLRNLKNSLLKIISQFSKLGQEIFDKIGIAEVFAKQHLLHFVVEFLCQIAPNSVCGTALSLSTGYTRGTISSRNLSVVFAHILVGVSVKTLTHFEQLINSGNFQRFDEGKEGNMIRYGSSLPPAYNVSLITSPVVLICSESDWFSTLKDINILSSQLPNLVEKYIVPEPSWSHNDHLWGNNATEYVFNLIVNYFYLFDENY